MATKQIQQGRVLPTVISPTNVRIWIKSALTEDEMIRLFDEYRRGEWEFANEYVVPGGID